MLFSQQFSCFFKNLFWYCIASYLFFFFFFFWVLYSFGSPCGQHEANSQRGGKELDTVQPANKSDRMCHSLAMTMHS